MAQRRMVSIKIIDSARFIKMPISSQALYFHLIARADDDGVVEAFNVMRMIGTAEDDLRVLVSKGYVSVLNEDLVSYITDWGEHNLIRADRKIDSIYKDLLLRIVPDAKLIEKKPRADINKTEETDGQWTDNGRTIVGIGKDRLGEVSIGYDNKEYSKKFSDDSFEMKCVKFLINSLQLEMPSAKIPNTDKDIDKWCEHIEKMVRLDKRTTEDIYRTLEYAREDSFWKPNIRSTSKFREKYETLYSQMKSKQNQQPYKAKATNKFNDFPQRDYGDMSSLEQRLLHRN